MALEPHPVEHCAPQPQKLREDVAVRSLRLELEWTGDPGPYVDVLSEYGPTKIVGFD